MTHSLDTPTSETSGSTPAGTSPGTSTGGPATSDTAKDQARAVGQTSAQAGKQVAGTAAEQAQHVTQETRRQAQDLLGQTREQAVEQARTGQQKAAGSLSALADELRSLTNGEGGSGPATDLLRQATDRVDAVAEHLRDREPGDLLEDVRRFARRRPGAFLLGAALAGVVAGRLTTGVVASHKEQDGGSSDGAPHGVSTGTGALPGQGGAAAGYAAVPPTHAAGDPAYAAGDPAYATGAAGPGYDPAGGYSPPPPAPYAAPVPPVDPGTTGDRPRGGGQA